MFDINEYSIVSFVDEALADDPGAIRALAICKFAAQGLTSAAFSPFHQPLYRVETEGPHKGDRYYQIQIRNGVAARILRAAAATRFGRFFAVASLRGVKTQHNRIEIATVH